MQSRFFFLKEQPHRQAVNDVEYVTITSTEAYCLLTMVRPPGVAGELQRSLHYGNVCPVASMATIRGGTKQRLGTGHSSGIDTAADNAVCWSR